MRSLANALVNLLLTLRTHELQIFVGSESMATVDANSGANGLERLWGHVSLPSGLSLQGQGRHKT